MPIERRLSETRKPNQVLNRLHRNKFFQTTPMFGFQMIRGAKNKYEIGFWYIIIIICLILTIKNVTALIIQYNSGETVTNMKIGRSNLALFPNMTFCVQLRLPEVNPEFMSKSRKNLSLLANVTSLQTEVDEALDNFMEKRDVMEKPWNYILLPLLFRYFTSMRLLEVEPAFLSPDATSTLSGTVLRTFLLNSSYYFPISRSIFSILNHTRSLGVSDLELFERFSQHLVAFSEFKAIYSERTMVSTETWTLKPNLKVLFFKLSKNIVHGFCFGVEPLERMSANQEKPEHVQSRLDFTISTETRDNILDRNYGFKMNQWAEAKNIGGKYEEQDLEKLEVILGDEFGEKEFLDFPVLTAAISTTIRAHVTTKAVYQSIVNCSPKQTKEQCIIQCKTDIITKFCNCSPLLLIKTVPFIQRNNSTQMCRIENYINCLKPSMINDYNKCVKSCSSACFNTKYRLTPHIIRKYGNYSKAKVYIYRIEHEYPIFSEAYAQSFASLFGELGGILGFYLGASMLALLHIVIYVIKQFTYIPKKANAIRRSRRSDHDRENNDKTNGSSCYDKINKANADLDLNERVRNIENVIKNLSNRIDHIVSTNELR